MVSPFMSFATGALGAVNTQINKYQQTEAAEALAEREQEKLFERAEFDRATKLQVADKTGDYSLQAARFKAKGKEGENFTNDNISIKRPEIGLKPSEFEKILGKRSGTNYQKDDPIKSFNY